MRELAVKNYAVKAVEGQRPELSQQLQASAARALGLFAGAEAPKGRRQRRRWRKGWRKWWRFAGCGRFHRDQCAEGAERAKAGEVLIRILNGQPV